MNPYVIEVILREKREDMLREAERQRRIAQYEPHEAHEVARQPAKGRLAVAVGNMLIRLGERLKERYAPQLELPAGSPR
jgi:hypothetical protein